MTDREMLELAALAAGREIVRWVLDRPTDVMVAVLSSGKHWQPMSENTLTDCDGDALRLAVALSLNLEVLPFYARITWFTQSPATEHKVQLDHYSRDVAGVTRRAVTRAAAEIGKAMKAEQARKEAK
jgi:hypothetical protein